jgi:hypothetical protein
MSEIQKLIQAVRRDFPSADLRVDENASNSQVVWLDIEHQGKRIVVEWRRGKGFGVSLLPERPAHSLEGLFEGPDEVFSDVVSAKDYIHLLLTEPSSRRAAFA